MKIVLVVHTAYPDFIGGREHHIHYLASELALTDKVVVIAGGKSRKVQKRMIEGYELITLPMISIKVSSNPLQIYRIIPKFLSYIKKEKPDVIHAFEYGSFSTDIACFYAKKHKTPFLLTVYGYQLNNVLLKSLKKIYDKIIGRFLYKTAHKIFFSSETQQNEILKIINHKYVADKLILQENSIQIDKYKDIAVNKELLNRYRKANEIVLLTVVRLLPRKGIKHLIYALRKIKDIFNIHNLKLIIVGPDCGELASIKNLVRTFDLESKVIFTGSVAPQRIKEFLGICDIFVLPSLYEGLPLALLEAMAVGKVVIFSDLACARKVIIDEESGLLVKPADADSLAEAIIKLFRDKEMRERLGLKAKKIVSAFDSNIEAKNMRKYYEQTLITNRTV
ncbi:MAG: glycosyltransferase family 4 protein [Candidatus Omnitrophota bacterium]